MEGNAMQYPNDSLRRIYTALQIMDNPTHRPAQMRCISCQGYFEDCDTFARHCKYMHGGHKYKCTYCHNRFETEQSLSAHLIGGHHRGFAFECATSQFGGAIWDGLTRTEFWNLVGHDILPPIGVDYPPKPDDGYYIKEHTELINEYGNARIALFQATKEGRFGKLLKKFKCFA